MRYNLTRNTDIIKLYQIQYTEFKPFLILKYQSTVIQSQEYTLVTNVIFRLTIERN